VAPSVRSFVPAPQPSAAPWTVVVLAWRPPRTPGGASHRVHFVTLLRARYGLSAAEATSLFEETLEAPPEPICLGAASEDVARQIATTADALGAEVRLVPGDDAGPALAEVRAAWLEAHPSLMERHHPGVWADLAAVAPAYRLR
jgi:hypothetical protein